jgi:hypothetical protein
MKMPEPDTNARHSHLLQGEQIEFTAEETAQLSFASDAEINEKYVKGEIRIVTEQARYPISTIAGIVEDPAYRLSPEYQRRHRWRPDRQSRLIESLIMNVPIPPIFLYEYDYSKYEVMDGLQRLTAIHDFYRDKFELTDLTEWVELNGKKYSQLPSKIKEGIDRRYLSSVILLKETARDERDALRLKQLVFERINSGGVRLSDQESRNAIFDGPLNQVCIKLSRNRSLCRLWGIPLATDEELSGGNVSDERISNDQFREMNDVELVLRFFAHRQKASLQKSGESLRSYHDRFLQYGNRFSEETLSNLSELFEQTIEFAEELLGERAFWLYRKRTVKGQDHWSWLERPATTVFDPLMLVLSTLLPEKQALLSKTSSMEEALRAFYTDNYAVFEGRNVNPSALNERERMYREFFTRILAD